MQTLCVGMNLRTEDSTVYQLELSDIAQPNVSDGSRGVGALPCPSLFTKHTPDQYMLVYNRGLSKQPPSSPRPIANALLLFIIVDDGRDYPLFTRIQCLSVCLSSLLVPRPEAAPRNTLRTLTRGLRRVTADSGRARD